MRQITELLEPWNSFYVMIGSAAAALTGLMFVVITLATDKQAPNEEGLTTFSSPNVFHFCCALFTAAFMAAPFRALLPIVILSSLAGAAGICYTGRTAILARRIQTYRADAEDWIWHVVLPLTAYATLFVGAVGLHANTALALYAPAAAVTLLIFIGIHNAWDVVTYLALGRGETASKDAASAAADES